MSLKPTQLKLTDEGKLRIHWSDDSIREYTPAELLDQCPCATCREKRKQPPSEGLDAGGMLPVITAEETRPLTIQTMRPVGGYAYSIGFSRGCDSGIYSFEFLLAHGREIGAKS